MRNERCWCGGAMDWADDTAICLDSVFHDPLATGRPANVTRLYVAGPMSGYPLNNYPEFNRVAAELRSAGYTVVNPAEVGPEGRSHYVDLLRQDLMDMMTCHGVAVIDQWWESGGARNEVQVAGILKMPVHHWERWLVLQSAPSDADPGGHS